jgi:ribosome-associated heat shock protein Hsp15
LRRRTRLERLPEPDPESIRLDRWLWQARFAKTRGLAAELVAHGAVRLNGRRVAKPAALVRIGDGLTVVQRGQIRVLRVRALGIRRGPAPEARALYRDLDADVSSPEEAAGRPLEPPDRVDK